MFTVIPAGYSPFTLPNLSVAHQPLRSIQIATNADLENPETLSNLSVTNETLANLAALQKNMSEVPLCDGTKDSMARPFPDLPAAQGTKTSLISCILDIIYYDVLRFIAIVS